MSDARDVTVYDKDGEVAVIVSCSSVAEAEKMRNRLRDILAAEEDKCKKLN